MTRQELLTLGEASRRVRLAEETVRRALRSGSLQGTLVCRRWRINPDDLDRWLAVHQPGMTTPEDRP